MTPIDLVVVYLWAVAACVVAYLAKLAVEVQTSPTPWRRKDISDIKLLLIALLRRGYDEGYILVAHEDSGRFLKFCKYIRPTGENGIELILPRADWTAHSLAKLDSDCDQAGFPRRETTESLKGSTVEVVLIDCGKDTVHAFELAVRVWTEYLGLKADSWFELTGDGFSLGGEFIRHFDHPRRTTEERQQFRSRRLRRRLREIGVTPRDILILSIITTIFLLCLIGLPVSTALSRGSPPDWSVNLAGFVLGGSMTSLAFVLLYVPTLVALRGSIRKLKSPWNQKPKSPTEKLIAIGLRSVVFTLPLVAVLVWSTA